jgi:YfiH family protein
MDFSWVLTAEGGFSFYELRDVRRNRRAGVVTLRTGGTSRGPFGGLNLSFGVGDSPSDVEDNRRLVAATLGLRERDCARPQQVHGGTVTKVHAPGVFDETDGLFSARPELWMALLVADCVPVFVLDEQLSMAGLAHAGRKGTALGITKSLINLAKTELGIAPHGLIAALGPSIGPCCYELDRNTASGLLDSCIAERDGKVFFDLWRANTIQALEAGIPEENVLTPPACTCCNSDAFFSHRAHRGTTGRQMAVTAPGGLSILPRTRH